MAVESLILSDVWNIDVNHFCSEYIGGYTVDAVLEPALFLLNNILRTLLMLLNILLHVFVN